MQNLIWSNTGILQAGGTSPGKKKKKRSMWLNRHFGCSSGLWYSTVTLAGCTDIRHTLGIQLTSLLSAVLCLNVLFFSTCGTSSSPCKLSKVLRVSNLSSTCYLDNASCSLYWNVCLPHLPQQSEQAWGKCMLSSMSCRFLKSHLLSPKALTASNSHVWMVKGTIHYTGWQ